MALITSLWVENVIAAGVAISAADAGDLRRALPSLSSPEKKNAPTLNLPRYDNRAAPPGDSSFKVWIDQVNFKGNTLFDDKTLRHHLKQWINRDLALSEMKQMANEVADLYRAKDYLVHAYIPPQSLDDNALRITIVEAKLGAITVSPGKPVRMGARRAISWITETTPVGALVNSNTIDRSLLLLDDLSGVRASVKLRRSPKPGHSDLVLDLAPEELTEGLLHASNSGSHSTGEERISAYVAMNSPLHRGGRLSADTTLSEHSQFLRASYRSPIGTKGLSASLEASQLQYSLDQELAALSGEGETSDMSAELIWAKTRSRTRNVNLGLSLGQSHFENRALGLSTSDYKIQELGVSIDGDSVGPHRWSQFQVRLSQGKLDLGSLDSSENTELPTSFNKLAYQFQAGWRLDPKFSAQLRLRGQYSPKPMDSAELFSLGGPNGVRAYPVNEGSGESARVLSFEITRPVNQQWQFSGFFDHGQVLRRAAGESVVADHYSLKGLGFSAKWNSPSGWNFNAQLARRIGENPNAAVGGRDQDGTLRKNRIWLSLHRSF